METGTKVYTTSRTTEECNASTTELTKIGTCITIPSDVSTKKGRKVKVGALTKVEEAMDIQANNAGVKGGMREGDRFDEYPEATFDSKPSNNLPRRVLMKEIKWKNRGYFLIVGYLAFVSFVNAEDSYSPYTDQSYPTNVYWGDTHLHTNLSVDAYGMGNKALGPDDAYRFAKGEKVTANNGMVVRLSRPLDFLVVADHGAYMGVMSGLAAGEPRLLKTEVGKRWSKFMQENPLNTGDLLNSSSNVPIQNMMKSIFDKGGNSFFWEAFEEDSIRDDTFRLSVWKEVTSNADRHNQPGKFTAFSGYEWSATVPASYHRVVIFKDAGDKVMQELPFTKHNSNDPEKLWAYLSHYENKTGGEAIAIPHNGNVTNGHMFSLLDFQGKALSTSYAKARSRWEPLYEVTQFKGDGEAHPALSLTDEFADYETWNSWNGWSMEGIKTKGWKERKKSEYARSALKLGLGQQVKLGVNPFKFGMIGSTDSHTSLATADENNFWGKLSLYEPSKYRITKFWDDRPLPLPGWEGAASGYAAIWAEENTREALFAAMKRKETYATTGPRMAVRFFGGWDYEDNDALKPDLAKIGYAKGVPMGGDLTNAPNDRSPTFLIRAVRDPDGANLDRVQVIKGWHDKGGELHEKIYDVALADNRKTNWRGKVKPVGSTVNIEGASYTNTIGDPELAVVWKDPDFDKNELAFYYVRVLEIPTPRWTAYDAKFFGLTDILEEVPMVTQERAYTSPIWFTPSASK